MTSQPMRNQHEFIAFFSIHKLNLEIACKILHTRNFSLYITFKNPSIFSLTLTSL